ncbi:MAG: master DNA invertase Mpi family serine-type recombinase [Alphaproteobacteria bacterium]|nr:master DNA invertase Mpi family serine-type recombinase [Alphaproteobacteria bacterium]
MIYGYIRVSTDKQTTENQLFEIEKFANKNNIIIDFWIKETISATKKLEKRKLGYLLKRLKKGDILISTELSRLGRNLLQVMAILSYCMNIGCQVWTIKDNYRLGADIQSKVLAFAFSLSAEIERTLISSRTKEALARVKKDGKKLGRPFGSTGKNKLDDKRDKVKKMKEEGLSMKNIAQNLKCGRGTLYRYLQKNPLSF